jgi:hypothetical protein
MVSPGEIGKIPKSPGSVHPDSRIAGRDQPQAGAGFLKSDEGNAKNQNHEI